MTRVLKGTGFLALLLLGSLLSSCSSEDTHEAIMKDHLALMEKAAAILEAVENKDSTAEAGKKLEQLSAQFEEIGKRSEAIGTLDKDSGTALQDKFKNATRRGEHENDQGLFGRHHQERRDAKNPARPCKSHGPSTQATLTDHPSLINQ